MKRSKPWRNGRVKPSGFFPKFTVATATKTPDFICEGFLQKKNHQRCSIYSPAVGYHAHRVDLSKNEMYNYIQHLKLPFEWDTDFQNHSKPSNAFSYLNYNKYHFQRTLYEFHPSGRALPFHRYRRRLSEKRTSTSSRSQCSA